MAFFDVRGIGHAELLPQGQTVNQNVYKNFLRRLMRSVKEKRRKLWKRGHGCFIMTMLQLIMPWEFGSFMPKIALKKYNLKQIKINTTLKKNTTLDTTLNFGKIAQAQEI